MWERANVHLDGAGFAAGVRRREMKKLLVMAGVAALAICTAAADTVKDGSVSVKPGRWLWKQETNILAIPIKEENIECLIPEEARITLSKLARDLEEGCGVDNVRSIQGGYLFKLKCTGKTKGEADASILHTDTTMKINAKGSATVGFIPAGFSMKADATYQGDCSTAEIAKAKERYLRENPGLAAPQ
jgi:Protein of unknown function (DUF3617)